jgi:hypothetical protein
MKILAISAGILIVLLSALGMMNCKAQLQIQNEGSIVKMKIIELPGVCSGTKAKYFMKVVYEGVTYSKQIGANFCETHRIGKNIEMKYLKGKDQILFPEEDVMGNLIAAAAICLFGIFIIAYALKTL